VIFFTEKRLYIIEIFKTKLFFNWPVFTLLLFFFYMQYKFNFNQKDLLVGTLLGNGNLQTTDKGQTWRYRVLHGTQCKDYVYHKYNVLSCLNLVTAPPRCSKVYDTRTKKFYERYYFNTRFTESLCFFGNLFYKVGVETGSYKKIVPVNIKKFLTPQAVAYWYMDDGSLKWLGRSNGMRLCTDSFSLEEVNRLRSVLLDLYGLETGLNRLTKNQGVCYRISIGETASRVFRAVVSPYILPCMLYKVSDGNKGHL
jgi:energy-coupling factor transporter transmembrane protein EcfT